MITIGRGYRAVDGRVAVGIDSLFLPISKDETLSILVGKGFRVLHVDVVSVARSCIGLSIYRRGVSYYDAPSVVDCSSFVKWTYGQLGIWLPRRSIQQRQYGEVVEIGDISAGDVVFVSGEVNYYFDDPDDGVGHVGIATGHGTVVHAVGRNKGVKETLLSSFVENKFRGVRRYIPKGGDVLTLEIPSDLFVETSDDLRWIVLQNIK